MGTIRTVALPVRPLAATEPRHFVEFYDNESDLVDGVAHFLGDGLTDGEVAIVVASPEHRTAIDTAMAAAGIDLLTSQAEGRYLTVDADDLMLAFIPDGRPERSEE